MALLPALADADLAGFGRALSEVQEITGRWLRQCKAERSRRARR